VSVTAISLDGRSLAQQALVEVKERITALAPILGQPPCLAVVQVGADPASAAYVRQIERTAARVGVTVAVHVIDGSSSVDEAAGLVARLCADSGVQGLIVQQPLPKQVPLDALIAVLNPLKDIDGLHPYNVGLLALGRADAIVPATPLGGLEILRRSGLPVSGQHAVIVGRSPIVGRPLASLLLREHATVTICHTRTRDLAACTVQGDIVAVAAGRAGLITAEMVRPGAVVLDFGVNMVDGRMVGDVAADVAQVAGWLTPVPGGTGPMTNAMLLRNLVVAAERQIAAK